MGGNGQGFNIQYQRKRKRKSLEDQQGMWQFAVQRVARKHHWGSAAMAVTSTLEQTMWPGNNGDRNKIISM